MQRLLCLPPNGWKWRVDNRWIIPYSKVLSKTFKAHINVDSCNSVNSIKYICKYANKGSDMVVFGVEQDGAVSDEVKQFQMGRYISSSEAMRRIVAFDIHQRYPTVTNLSVHLENGLRVYFTEECPPSLEATSRNNSDRLLQTLQARPVCQNTALRRHSKALHLGKTRREADARLVLCWRNGKRMTSEEAKQSGVFTQCIPNSKNASSCSCTLSEDPNPLMISTPTRTKFAPPTEKPAPSS